MSGQHQLGATREEWQHWSDPLALDLGPNLLPVVPDPNARRAPYTKVQKFGKIPSEYDADGNAYGLTAWTKRQIAPEDIERWTNDGRLGICLRLGERSAVAIDVDCSDPTRAAAIYESIVRSAGALPRRERANSSKFLLLFRLPGSHKKRVIKLPDDERIEFLATGQQCLVAGPHPSGARYAWRDGLPTSLPTITPEIFETVWNELQETFGIASASEPTRATPHITAFEVRTSISDEEWSALLKALKHLMPHLGEYDLWAEAGLALLSLKSTERPIKQLWFDLCRKAPNYDAEAAERWWEINTTTQPRSDYRHIFRLAREHGWRETSEVSDFPVVPAEEKPPVQLQRNPGGTLLSNTHNAVVALYQQNNLQIAYDEFKQKVLLQWPDDASLRPLTEEDVTRVQIELQKQGMFSMSERSAYSALRLVAKRNTFNSVADYLLKIDWDGVRRLSRVCDRGFGTPFDRFHCRAFRNLFIALAARGLNPGCQVDEAIVLEGPQGSRKSSALRIIGGEHFAELTASPNSKDFEQQLQGVWLGEFAELNALRRTEDIARIKQFVTNRTDHIRLPYDRVTSDLPRRTVLCGSTNEDSWLHDPTGGRRFIPVEVGQIDLKWLSENRNQLFAEAVALYRAGRKWHVYPRADTLERQESRSPDDPWLSRICDYLCGRPEVSNIAELLDRALNIPIDRQKKADSTRVGHALKKLGCVPLSRRRIDGRLARPWTVPADLTNKPMMNYGPAPFSPVPTPKRTSLVNATDNDDLR